MYKMILWGLGNCYNLMKNTIAWYEITKQMEVVCIAASDVYMEKLDGYRVIHPSCIRHEEYDYILVMSDIQYHAIVECGINEYGIPRNKMISYKILQIPQLNLDDYFKVYESNITIVSNNCWGGLIYNTLGIECISPFKNLFLNDDDYIKCCMDLAKYMNEVPVFSHYESDLHSRKKYPVLHINDIEIHCNHADNEAQAIEDWERRRKKINWSNIYYEMYTANQEVADRFVDFLGDKKGICFVPWETNAKRMLYLQQAPNQKYFWEAVIANATLGTYGLKYSIVDLLLGEIQLRY